MQILTSVYNGTFGLFSLAMVISFSLSFGMEKNETVDKVAMYLMVALAAYGAQLGVGTNHFDMESIGTKGSFSAIFIALVSCYLYEKLKKSSLFTMRKYTMGMESVCASAIAAFLPMIIIVGIVMAFTQVLYMCFDVYSLHELFSKLSCALFDNLSNSFGSGLLYTFKLHLLWLLGFHGSHLLEPVAQTTFANATGDAIFSKSFFDTYIVMGGCGTTICVLIILIFFYRKDRLGNLAKISAPMTIFNLNEVLNFGVPIILNPIMGIPFILTPIACYCIAYGATAIGLVPRLVTEVPWSTPIIISGYVATDSIRGALLQIVCIVVGICIYFPFLRIHKRMQEVYAKEKIKMLVTELQEKEQEKEKPMFITRADSLGLISRMLVEDLKVAINQDKLYMLYQPQVDAEGRCIGGEALLRWNHPLYGMIFPPLMIYLAKEGELLPALEEKIFDMAGAAIKKTSEEYGEDFKISVNITAKSLLWDVESCIDASLKKYDIPAEKLWIEMTEQDEYFEINGYHIHAFRVKHNVLCYGYSVEIKRNGKFSVERAKAQNIPMKFWNPLQKGQTIESDGIIYTPDMVLGEERKGIKVTYCTDSRPLDCIVDAAKASDLFICEGMYAEKEKIPNAKKYKHMTFYEAADMAKKAEVTELWLTHFSPSLVHPEEYLPEVRKIFENSYLGKDGKSVELQFDDAE